MISVFMQQIYGGWAGKLVTLLIIWTAFGSVFSLLLGYSRVPYAAALDGNYFAVFGTLHPKLPISARFAAGAGRGGHGVLRLAACRRDRRAGGDSHAAAIPAAAGGPADSAQARHPEMPRPFRMWLYPLPALWPSPDFVYMLISRPNFLREIRYAVVVLVRAWCCISCAPARRGEWPFDGSTRTGAA